jgi:hypothetical protein
VDAGIAVTKILDSVLCLRLIKTCKIFQTGPGPGIFFLMSSSKYSPPFPAPPEHKGRYSHGLRFLASDDGQWIM